MKKTARLDYAISETLTNVRRNPFISVAAILVMTISLFMFGSVLLLRGAIQRTAELWTGNVEVAIFLADGISSDERNQLRAELESLPEVASVSYESKEAAYKSFLKLFAANPELTRNTSPEALPDSFRVKLKDPEQYGVIRDRFENRPAVRHDQQGNPIGVRDDRDVVDRLFEKTRTLRSVGLSMALIVAFAGAVLIATTIRMGIFTRRREIGIMKLVGATNWFVRGPFMVEGLAQGLLGALFGVALLIPVRGALGRFGASALPVQGDAFQFHIPMSDVFAYGGVLLLIGAAIGVVGSLLGLRRFLDV